MYLGSAAAIGTALLALVLGVQDHETATSDNSSAKDKKICRQVVPTGSVMPTRICLTKAEWAEVNNRNKDSMERMRGARLVGCPPNKECG